MLSEHPFSCASVSASLYRPPRRVEDLSQEELASRLVLNCLRIQASTIKGESSRT
jgi:hypothetical protein